MRSYLLALVVVISLPGCEPQDKPGSVLLEIRVVLSEKNPGIDGNYILHVGEHSRLMATGLYSNGREETITLSMFWNLSPGGPAQLICQQDQLIGSWVILQGQAPGVFELRASTREEDEYSIPCSPTPDGGWSFTDAGPDWPVYSQPISIEVR